MKHVQPKGSCCAPARQAHNGDSDQTHSFDCESKTVASTTGMRLIEGGSFLMGSPIETPVHEVQVDAFYMDSICVTNEEFNEFVNATGYRTEAERLGWSFVFGGHLTPADQDRYVRQRVSDAAWWCQVDGANWRHPEGPTSNIKKRWKHPVVQVSWNDAFAYAVWAGKRLPTEAEWEVAARGGLVQKWFPWGDEREPNGQHMMNVWQGQFPYYNREADGYYSTAPAKSYRPNGFGLYNMTGNVWEWCSDWFGADYYDISPPANPPGPSAGQRKVIRGGSYLCHHSYCNRYRTDARFSNTPESATTNCGFRCVVSVAHT